MAEHLVCALENWFELVCDLWLWFMGWVGRGGGLRVGNLKRGGV